MKGRPATRNPRPAAIVVVFVTCPSLAVARRLSRYLIERKLAACVNVVPRVESTFRWQGKVERCAESLLIIKTARKRFPALQAALLSRHPYQVPEIIGWPLAAGFAPYLRWVVSSAS